MRLSVGGHCTSPQGSPAVYLKHKKNTWQGTVWPQALLFCRLNVLVFFFDDRLLLAIFSVQAILDLPVFCWCVGHPSSWFFHPADLSLTLVLVSFFSVFFQPFGLLIVLFLSFTMAGHVARPNTLVLQCPEQIASLSKYDFMVELFKSIPMLVSPSKCT